MFIQIHQGITFYLLLHGLATSFKKVPVQWVASNFLARYVASYSTTQL